MQPATKPRPLAAEITARQRKRWPYGKRSKKRAVPMSRRIQALLEPYFSLNDKWFIGRRQVQKVVQRVAERARISPEVTPHVLRHTFATLAIQMAAIQKILGHDRLGNYGDLSQPHRHPRRR